MTVKVYGQLFGNPQIFLDDQPVFFPFSKINGLLYYLFINKTVSRDEMAGLLWPDKNEQNAKKNLRNTIYQANKALGAEYISSPNKVLLVLNEELGITSDVDLFLRNPKEHLDLYQGEFLKGFFLKDSEGYDFWMVKMRNYYEKKFVREGYLKIEEDMEAGKTEDIERNIQRLISIDEFDEKNYQLLMRYYQEHDRNGKVIETYYALANSLKVELGINPSNQTREIYEKSLEIVNQHNLAETSRFTSLFFGRSAEIQEMETTLTNFYHKKPAQSILLLGDAGIGKSALCNRVLDNIQDEFFVLESQCYHAEKRHPLRPWKKIIEKLSLIIKQEALVQPTLWQEVISKVFPDFEDNLPNVKLLDNQEVVKLTLLTQVITEAIKKVSLVKQLVIVFEDIQWSDSTSASLLLSVMFQLDASEALFIFTSRKDTTKEKDYFISTLNTYDKLRTIELKPFTKEETAAFVAKKVPNLKLTPALIDTLYQNTEGNIFFLVEYVSLLQTNSKLDIMTVKMQDALKNRFLYLSPDEQEVVNLVSYFYDSTPIFLLAELLAKDTLDIVNTIESLVNKHILVEQMEDEKITVSFTHSKLREYIYLNQPLSKKRVIHNKIAEALEKTITPNMQDSLLFSKIASHYEEAKNDLKSLDYELRYLQSYLGFHHELFPVYSKRYLPEASNIGVDQEEIYAKFAKIRQKLDTLEPTYQESNDYQVLAVKFKYLEGRYYIRYGDYEQGINDIQTVITKARELNNDEYVLNGYKQMIYYYIQTDNAEGMFRYVELALDAAIKGNNHESIGILLRLKAIYYIMVGNTFIAEKLLLESINTFALTEEVAKKYSINIAASYNYLGEIRHTQGEYDEALEYFQKAIELCEDKGSLSSLSVFYINSGMTLFAKKQYKGAKEYLEKAYALYENFSSVWKRTELDSYMALIALKEENYADVFTYLESAQSYADVMSNPRDLGVVYFAEALIKHYFERKELQVEDWTTNLGEDSSIYYHLALVKLNDNRDVFEIDTLKSVFKEK